MADRPNNILTLIVSPLLIAFSLNVFGLHLAASVISTVVYIIFVARFYTRSFDLAVATSGLCFMILLAIIGGVTVEAGAYIVEQERDSYGNGSTFYLVVANIVYLSFLFNRFESIQRFTTLKKLSDKTFWSFALIYGVCLSAILLDLYSRQISIFTQSDLRFSYWRDESRNPLVRIFAGTLYLGFGIIGVALRSDLGFGHRLMARVLLFFGLCFYLLIGEKFSGYFLPVTFFLMGRFSLNTSKSAGLIRLKQFLQPLILGGVAVVCLVALHYSNLDPLDKTLSVGNQVLTRLALQGHVWWITFDINYSLSVYDRLEQILTEIGSIEFAFFKIENSSSAQHGVKFLMGLIGNENNIQNWYNAGVIFSGGYPAIGLYCFGFLGLIVLQFVLGCLTGYFLKKLLEEFAYASIVGIIICEKIVAALFEFNFSGDIVKLLSAKNIIALAFFLTIQIRRNEK
jgi:hypothetical protein